MPLKQETLTELKNLITASDDYEGKYYLLFLYEHLTKSNRSEKELEPIAQCLINLIKNINDLKNPACSLQKQFNAAMQISENYQALVQETGAAGVLYKVTQALLDLGGLMIGMCMAVFGAALGAFSIGMKDITNFRLPTGLFIGAMTGVLVGFTLGQRVPHSLFKEKETRLLRHTVNKLGTTFESLYQSVEHDYITEIKQEILTDYFSGNQEQFNAFLMQKQKFEILSVQASFFSTKLKGSVGHHSFIKFLINENQEKPKLIEMGLPSDQETEFSQRELREATGAQLVRMLAMNRIIHPQYTRTIGNVFGILTPYQAGINDCHTYLDKILTSVSEAESQIDRFTPEDSLIGQFIGGTILFFKPVPEKLEHSVLAEENMSPQNKL
ncbi:hypothetical protein [uncultured Legionella sp.]|uniref:hypothetical protein n=1 Tax=uncultured Legionella sp. TaxID=210934 RepID=UPI002637BEAC|nr:hypothetical protein [uncultured Legionella sp.]